MNNDIQKKAEYIKNKMQEIIDVLDVVKAQKEEILEKERSLTYLFDCMKEGKLGKIMSAVSKDENLKEVGIEIFYENESDDRNPFRDEYRVIIDGEEFLMKPNFLKFNVEDTYRTKKGKIIHI